MYVALIIAAVIIVRLWLHNRQVSAREFVRNVAIAAVIILIVVMTVTGRLPWMVAAAVALLAFAGRVLTLVGLLPLFRAITGNRGRWRGFFKGGRAAPGNQSSVHTRFFDMSLDHDSGRMDGKVLTGRYTGRMLSQLTLTELTDLLTECRWDDDSVNVLEAYLDRTESAWRETWDRSGGRGRDSASSQATGTMDEVQALEILGLEPGASRDEIIAAHRRLMQKVHPDRGGSTYLAAKLNEAKDFLLS